MKNKKSIFACALSCTVLINYVLPVAALSREDANGLRSALLLGTENSGNVMEYNTNNDNEVNVLDLCRTKQSILYGTDIKEQAVSFECERGIVGNNGSTITIPVKLSKNSVGISSFQFYIDYNENFTLTDVYMNTDSGKLTYSDVFNVVQFISDDGNNFYDTGTILYMEFKATGSVREGDYEFSLYDIQAITTQSDGAKRELDKNECPVETKAVSVHFSYEEPVVTTTQITTTEVTTTPVTTTVTEAATSTSATINAAEKTSFSMNNAELSSDGRKLRVPVYMENNKKGLACLNMIVSYDTNSLTLTSVSKGEFDGFGYVAGNRDNAVFMTNNSQNISAKSGIVAYLEFDVNSAAYGSCDFRLNDIKASYTENWNQQNLSENDYVSWSELYTYVFEGVVTTVTVPVTTTVITTTTPEPTTTVITTTTPEPTTTVMTTTTPEVTTTVTTTTTPWFTTKPPVTEATAVIEPVEEEIINLINNDRISNGKVKTRTSSGLCNAADIRAYELAISDFNMEKRPNGESLEALFSENGVTLTSFSWIYTAVYTSANDVYKAVLDLKTSGFDAYNNNRIGVGHYYDPSSQYKHYWVVFIGR